ncbi:hypothetical protein AAMO2058_001288100 [Amorphochlora amoebiformis]|eukprot:904397-Amorphochlora_amoeboformis.AAC.1
MGGDPRFPYPKIWTFSGGWWPTVPNPIARASRVMAVATVFVFIPIGIYGSMNTTTYNNWPDLVKIDKKRYKTVPGVGTTVKDD